ncbi:MAG: DUF2586 family protein [Bacteroidia bacterium]|nr:DUF2586 family protein [Bacteroidia bacterium]
MPLPNVNVSVIGGGLGQVEPNQDGVAWLIVGGVSTPSWNENKINLITSLQEAEDVLGITKTNNPLAFAHIYDFYTLAGSGAKLYLTLLPDGWASNYTDVGNTLNLLKNQVPESVRLIGISPADGQNTFTQGIRQSVIGFIATANIFASERCAQYKPTSVILDGFSIDMSESNYRNLKGASEMKYVSVVLSHTPSLIDNNVEHGHDLNACVGLVLGRLAKIPVQRNLGRVKDGDLLQTNAYLNTDLIETVPDSKLQELHEKGYIFMRKHVGLPGYYFNDDTTCTPATSDFNSIARVRVIEKARRIVRSTLLPYLLDEVEIDPETGRLSASFVKEMQAVVENALDLQMTTNNEIISNRCVIDPKQNVLATNKIDVVVKIIPFGYAKQIEVTVSFENPAS